MSTRSEIYITANNETIRMYQHYDGYFKGVGFYLAESIIAIKQQYQPSYRLGVFIKTLLESDYTISMIPAHDIEYVYDVNFDPIGDGHIKVLGCQARYNRKGILVRGEQRDMLKMLVAHINETLPTKGA